MPRGGGELERRLRELPPDVIPGDEPESPENKALCVVCKKPAYKEVQDDYRDLEVGVCRKHHYRLQRYLKQLSEDN